MRYVDKLGPATLTEVQGAHLVALARAAIADALGRTFDSPTTVALSPTETGAVFVTLRKHGRLRGCVGMLDWSTPLVRSVRNCALQAAFNDPRFEAVGAHEFGRLHIEISLLSPLRRIAGPSDILIGRDGLVIEKGTARGLLLPQVAVEFQADADRFLAMASRKADLPEDGWRSATLHAFTVQSFAESAPHEDLPELS